MPPSKCHNVTKSTSQVMPNESVSVESFSRVFFLFCFAVTPIKRRKQLQAEAIYGHFGWLCFLFNVRDFGYNTDRSDLIFHYFFYQNATSLSVYRYYKIGYCMVSEFKTTFSFLCFALSTEYHAAKFLTIPPFPKNAKLI
uniref:7TM_GPCR_Srx domain-containing protein n=1 Tax=Panagrellus redivivus TaxID=6233 RepID=A0A7E4VYB1_PANRE